MSTYGELKREIPDMSDEALDDLRRSCIQSIRDGIKPVAERDLLDHIRMERLNRREQHANR